MFSTQRYDINVSPATSPKDHHLDRQAMIISAIGIIHP